MQQNDDRCYYCIYCNTCDEQDEECIDVDYDLDDTSDTWKEFSYNKYIEGILER